MVWLISGSAVVAVGCVILLLRRELQRQEGGGTAFLVPLRLVNGILLILVLLLVAAGVIFAMPRPGAESPGSMMLAYWLFIALLLAAIGFLTLLDMFLVRVGYRRHQDEALREVLFGGARRRREAAAPPPEGDRK